MNFKEEAQALDCYIKEHRRYIHQHPELTFHEKATTAYIKAALEAENISTEVFPDFYGVIGTIKGDKPGKTVLLRADIDALGITEAKGLSFASVNAGVMHACGHDCHTAMLLAAGKILQTHKAELAGTVKLLFQASEESGHGSVYYIDHGYLSGVDGAMAIHVMPDIPAGTLSIEEGPRMASCTNFYLKVKGTSAHGSTPNLGKDAIVAASSILMNLQTLVSRENSPLNPLVITFGSVRAGKQFNIICDNVELAGTIRTFSTNAYETVPARVKQVAEDIAGALGCSVEYSEDTKEPAATNDQPELVAIGRQAAVKLYGENILQHMQEKMGSEDFSFISHTIPGLLCFLGYYDESCGAVAPLHSEKFLLNDAILTHGAALYAQFAYDYLEKAGKAGAKHGC
jgi:amidohydrolase